MQTTILLNLVVLLVTAASVPAATRLVPDEYATIQAAIDACVDDDVVIVAPGTYTGSGNRNLDFGGKAITVVSQSGPSATIIDGNDSSVVVFDDNEGKDAILQGFTIRGGTPAIVIASASPTIVGNVITGYVVTGDGSIDRVAGIDIFGSSSPTILENIITENVASVAGSSNAVGAIRVSDSSSPTITRNIITGNVAAVGGSSTVVGAIKISGSSSPIVINNIISKNGAIGAGGCTIVGGIWVCAPATPVIINNTITNNCSTGGGSCILVGGVASLKPCPTCGGAWSRCPECKGLGWVLQDGAGPLLANNIVWGNSIVHHGGGCTIVDDFYAKGTYSLIGSGITDGVGNITGNPMLARSFPIDKVLSTCPFPEVPPAQLVLCPLWWAGLSFTVGDTLELNFDGVPRTVLEIREHQPHWDSMTVVTVVFSPPRTKQEMWYGREYVVNWGSETDLSLDYHLLADSPCINAGDPAGEYNGQTDIDGEPRVIGRRVDMGADEYPNTTPVACIVGGDRTIEATGLETRVTLDGSCSSDSDSTPGTNDDIAHFDWYKVDACDPNFEDFIGSGEIIDCNLPLGEHIIVLEVIDKAGAFDTNEVTIIVQDTTPPEFTLSVIPTTLWPANHKMVLITLSWTASDICDASPEVTLVSITMNESDETKGSGHTTDDIQIGDDGSIYLRAERSGSGSGRIYTITYQAADDSGNVAVASATVTIPHGQR